MGRRKTIVVNLMGGPGVAKSIFCAKIFVNLKLKGVNCEMAREFAKDKIWEGSAHVLENQHAVYGEQQRRIFTLDGQVDVVITDAPIFNSLIYDIVESARIDGREEDKSFQQTVTNEFKRYNNRNYVLTRVMGYEQEGRYQDEQGAKEIDKIVVESLEDNGVKYKKYEAWPENADVITREILKELEVR